MHFTICKLSNINVVFIYYVFMKFQSIKTPSLPLICLWFWWLATPLRSQKFFFHRQFISGSASAQSNRHYSLDVPRLSFSVFVGRRNILSEESYEHMHTKMHINKMFHHLLRSLWPVEKAVELWKWRNSIWQQKASLSIDERSNESMYFDGTHEQERFK